MQYVKADEPLLNTVPQQKFLRNLTHTHTGIYTQISEMLRITLPNIILKHSTALSLPKEAFVSLFEARTLKSIVQCHIFKQ